MSRIQPYNLGQQMNAVSQFLVATAPGSVDYVAARNTWNELRQRVFPKYGLAPDHFGPFPATSKEVLIPSFADRAVGVFAECFSGRVKELAGEYVSFALYKREGVTPHKLLDFATAGIVSVDAVRAFHVSATHYLCSQFSAYGITLGTVIEEAIELANLSPAEAAARINSRSWAQYLNVLGLDPSNMRVDQDETEEEYRLRAMPLIGHHINETLRMLMLHGPLRPLRMQDAHDLTLDLMQRGIEHKIISNELVSHIWDTTAARINDAERYRNRLRGGGTAGLIGTMVVGGSYAFAKGFNYDAFVERMTTPSYTLLFLACAAVAFGIMAFAPEWFIDE